MQFEEQIGTEAFLVHCYTSKKKNQQKMVHEGKIIFITGGGLEEYGYGLQVASFKTFKFV